MITEIAIENYKSIRKLKLELGSVNVFIGENGAGKSNLLEVIALAGATAAEKLDNEFLSSRGIRVTRPEFMRSAFSEADAQTPIKIDVKDVNGKTVFFSLNNDNALYSKWTSKISTSSAKLDFTGLNNAIKSLGDPELINSKNFNRPDLNTFFEVILKGFKEMTTETKNDKSHTLKGEFNLPDNTLTEHFREILAKQTLSHSDIGADLSRFVIYSPENSSLRKFESEGQIEPLGINGEGLLKLLTFYANESNENILEKIKKSLKVLDWFDDFSTISGSNDARILIKDRYLDKCHNDFDHKSTNEGFLFLLFYFLLFNSTITPKFFAIDNIDASLNPKLCSKLMIELIRSAKENSKQVILTTHNPAVLDGLNLDDSSQRLFVISRGRDGTTKIKRVKKPIPVDDAKPVRLSELFLRGSIGGLPKGF